MSLRLRLLDEPVLWWCVRGSKYLSNMELGTMADEVLTIT